MRIWRGSVFFSLWLAAAPGFSQSTAGAITGIISDSTGAAIPAAVITITNVSTGVVTRTASNGSGVYVATSLLPGPYTVGARSDGFKTRPCKPARNRGSSSRSRWAPSPRRSK